MPALRDITGQKFGRLTAIRCTGKNERGQHTWLFQCDCGAQLVIVLSDATSSNTQSCGCLAREAKKQRFVTHGHSRRGAMSGEYRAWSAMHRRCRNPRRKNYHGRGITVCERWQRFENFLADMGPKPSPKHQTDRFPNKGGHYEPGNVRWATPIEQANNTRVNHLLTIDGQTLTTSEWARETNIAPKTLRARVKYGWHPDWLLVPFPGMSFWEG
jgi:hypothetical protein